MRIHLYRPQWILYTSLSSTEAPPTFPLSIQSPSTKSWHRCSCTHRRKQRAGSSSSSCRCDDGTICLSCALCNCMHIIGRPIMNQTVCSRPHVTTIQYESAQCVYYVKKEREREIRRSIKVNAFEFQFIFLCVCCCNDWPTPSSSVWKFLLTCCEELKTGQLRFLPGRKRCSHAFGVNGLSLGNHGGLTIVDELTVADNIYRERGELEQKKTSRQMIRE